MIRYTERRHLMDITEIFNLIPGAKRIRLYKLGYLVVALIFSVFCYRSKRVLCTIHYGALRWRWWSPLTLLCLWFFRMVWTIVDEWSIKSWKSLFKCTCCSSLPLLWPPPLFLSWIFFLCKFSLLKFEGLA